MKNTNGLFFIFSILLLACFSGDFLLADEAEYPGGYSSGDAITATGINERFENLYNQVNQHINHYNLEEDEASLSKVSGGAMTSTGTNIGIGTDPGSYKLYVSGGELKVESTGNAYIYLSSPDGATIFHMTNEIADIDKKMWQICNHDGMLSFRSRKDDSSSKYYTLQLLADGNTYVIGNLGVGTATPTARLEVDGYTKLGTDAPAVKMKRLTGTTGATADTTVNVSHGLDATKIIGWTAIVHQATTWSIPPLYERDPGYLYYAYQATNEFRIYVSDEVSSEYMLDKPFNILVWYIE